MFGDVVGIITSCGKFCGTSVGTDEGPFDGSTPDNEGNTEGLIVDTTVWKLEGTIEGVN